MPAPSRVEAIAAYLRALAPGGIVSIPVSIREFPVYALRMLATARAALLAAGHRRSGGACARLSLRLERAHPALPRAVRRRADRRGARVLRRPLVRLSLLSRHRRRRRRGPTSTTTCRRCPSSRARSTSGGPAHDAIADEAGAVLAGRPTPSAASFNLAPITLDRPSFYAVLRLDRLGTILQRLEMLPQAGGRRAGQPGGAGAGGGDRAGWCCWCRWRRGRRLRAPGGDAGARRCISPPSASASCSSRSSLIERASFLAGRPHQRLRAGADRDAGLLRAGQHGLGALRRAPGAGARRWRPAWSWSGARRCWSGCSRCCWPRSACRLAARVGAACWRWSAPVSVALGLPFPLGLARTGRRAFLPWAWGLNGAFSVVATPLANLIARQDGYSAGFCWPRCCCMRSPSSLSPARGRPRSGRT